MGLLVASGGFTHSETDLSIAGRELGFAFIRVHRSQAIHQGPLGRNWDSPLFARMTTLPNGDVEYRDGTGRVDRFLRQGKAEADGCYFRRPAGRFGVLELLPEGLRYVTGTRAYREFDRFGRLVRIQGRYDKNHIDLHYDGLGRLGSVRDELGRAVVFGYDAKDRIERVEDFTGRVVRYGYGGNGEDSDALTSVTAVERHGTEGIEELDTRYTYQALPLAPNGPALGLGIVRITSPRGIVVLTNTYDGHRLSGQRWGSAPGDLVTMFYEGLATTVSDRNGNETKYVYDADGQVTRIEETDIEVAVPGEATQTFTYATEFSYEHGLLTRTVHPGGDITENVYNFGSPFRRRQSDLVRVHRKNANESTTLTWSYVYNEAFGIPEVEEDPGGHIWRNNKVNPEGDVTERLGPALDESGVPAWSYTYNLYGQLQEETPPGGDSPTSYRYWPETDPGGTGASAPGEGLDSTTGGYLRRVTRAVGPGADALVTETLHDARGNPVTVTNPSGGIVESEYNDRDLPVKVTRRGDDGAYETRLEYDRQGNLARRTSPRGTRWSYDYDDLGNELRETIEGAGLLPVTKTEYTYDGNRNRLSATADGTEPRVVDYEYDGRDRLVRVHRAKGTWLHSTEAMIHDASDRIIRRYAPEGYAGGPSGEEFVYTRIEYDDFGRVTEEEHPSELIVRYEYTAEGLPHFARYFEKATDANPEKLVQEVEEEQDSHHRTNVRRETPPPGEGEAGEVVYKLDVLGRPEEVTDRRGQTTTYGYWANGWLASETDPLGNRTAYTYDPLGSVATVTETPSGGAPAIVVTRTYDKLGRLVAEEDAGGHRTERRYDGHDNLVGTVDPLGKGTSYVYDGLDRLTRVEGPHLGSGTANEILVQGYNNQGDRTSYKDARGNTTTYEYDLLGRQAAAHYPGSPLATYAYTYTRSDEVKTETSPRGHVSTFTYDQADRATGRSVVDGEGEPVETVTYAYDPFDRVLRVENGTAIVTRTYDAYGNERTETLEVKGAAVGARTLTRTYDIGHGVDGTSYPSGATTLDLDLDGMGRWAELKENGSPAVDYEWTGPRLNQKTVKGGLASSYGYDATERMLDSIQRTSAGSPVFDWSLRWTERHEIEAEVDKRRRETENRYEFDGSGRLGQASYQVPKDGDVEEARRRVEYELDGVRNIERMVEKLAGEYGAEKEATIESGNAYGSFAGEAIEDDAEGNVTGIGEELTLEWTWDNRLARVTRDGATVRYGYDPLGRKVKREVENGPTRLFWYDGWELIEETDESGTVKWEGVTGQGVDEQLYYSPAMGGEYRVFHDRLGSVAGLVNETGAVVERYEYDPYGRMHRDGPEHVDHVRLEYPDLVLRFTGEIDYDSAMEPGRLVFLPVVEGEWEQSGDGRELRFTPDDTNWPATSVTLSIAKEIRAWTAIELQEGRELTWDAGDETDRILEDWVAPTVEYVVQDEDGTVRVRFSEAVDPTTVGSGFELSDPVPSPMNQTTTVEEADPKTVRIVPSEEMTEEGLYALELSPGTIKDVSGLHAAEADTWTWQHEPKPITIEDGFDTPEQPSLFENRFFFQGRELDPVTRLYDFRNRWYDPEMGRFLTRDPLGYPDGPNQYAAFLSDPANNSDPTGQFVWIPFLIAAAFTASTEVAQTVAPDSFVGNMSLSSGIANAAGGLDPATGRELSTSERVISGVGAAGHAAGLAGTAVKALTQGGRAVNALARTEQALSGAEAGLQLASGNPLGAVLAGLGARGGPDVRANRALPASSRIVTDPARMLPSGPVGIVEKGLRAEQQAMRMAREMGETVIPTQYAGGRGIDFASFTGKGAEARLFLNEVKDYASGVPSGKFTVFGLGRSGSKNFSQALRHSRRAIDGFGLDDVTRMTLLDQLDAGARIRLIGGASTVFDARVTQRIGEATGFVAGEGFRLPGVR